MSMRVQLMGIVAAAAATVALSGTPVFAQAGVTADEVKCESGTGKALSKFVAAKGKCVQKCLATARKTSGPYTDCYPPFGGATAACIQDATKGAEAKARAAIVKACTKDCPECYAASVCSTGEPFVGDTETQLDGFSGLVFCVEDGGNTPTKIEAKCEDTVSKTLIKFVAAKSKCYDKCNQNVFKAKIPEGSCTPGSVSDPATQTCITKAESKAGPAIDKACATAGANPACYGTGFDSGAEWVSVTEGAVDSQVDDIACGSPSSAFVD